MTCAFAPCSEVTDCAMVGGCVNKRFPKLESRDAELPKAKAERKPVKGKGKKA